MITSTKQTEQNEMATGYPTDEAPKTKKEWIDHNRRACEILDNEARRKANKGVQYSLEDWGPAES